MRKWLSNGFRSGALSLGIGLAACTLAAPAFAQSWDEVVAGAKKEGRVVFYYNTVPTCIDPLMADFRAANPGIETETVRLASGAMLERISTEYAAGRHLFDVAITFEDDRLLDGMKQGWMLEWTPPELPNFPADVNKNNMLFALMNTRNAIIYNKMKVTEANAPKAWADLWDAKWKGKVGMNPPWRSVPVQELVALWDKLGYGDTAQKLKDNDVRFFEGAGGVIQAVIRGDVDVAEVLDQSVNTMLQDGAPIGVVYPEAGTTTSYNMAFVGKNAPHPNAAKVLLNWLMTAEGQKSFLVCGQSMTRKGAPALSHLPATSTLPNVVAGASLLNPEKQAALIGHWRSVFGLK